MEPRISDLLDLLDLLHNTGNSLSDTVFRSIWSTAFYSSALLWMCLWCSGHSCDYKFMWSCICVCVCVCVCVKGKGPEWGARTGSKTQTTHSCCMEGVGVRKCVGAWHSQKHTISHIEWGRETVKKRQIAIYWFYIY